MFLNLSLEEVKQAVAEYLNRSDAINKERYEVKPEHVEIVSHVEGQYEDSCQMFDGVRIDLSKCEKK